MTGKFITFEGSEGSGKSTQAQLIFQYLRKKKIPAVFLREPGGVKISEAIRRILLDVQNQQMSKECEMLLYMAARAQLVSEVILPAFKKGKVVLGDRFLDSTIVYQGYGCGIDLALIKKIGALVTHQRQPDLTFLFDLDVREGLSRLGRKKDRIEERSLQYHNRVRQGYLTLAQQEPRRIRVIPADRSRTEIHSIVRKHVDRLLKIK